MPNHVEIDRRRERRGIIFSDQARLIRVIIARPNVLLGVVSDGGAPLQRPLWDAQPPMILEGRSS